MEGYRSVNGVVVCMVVWCEWCGVSGVVLCMVV